MYAPNAGRSHLWPGFWPHCRRTRRNPEHARQWSARRSFGSRTRPSDNSFFNASEYSSTRRSKNSPLLVEQAGSVRDIRQPIPREPFLVGHVAYGHSRVEQFPRPSAREYSTRMDQSFGNEAHVVEESETIAEGVGKPTETFVTSPLNGVGDTNGAVTSSPLCSFPEKSLAFRSRE